MNYNEMTNAELDRLSAEKFGIVKKFKAEIISDSYMWPSDNTPNQVPIFWNPTHPDSNQAERFLFKRLLEDVVVINTKYTEDQPLLIWIGTAIDIDDEHEEICCHTNDPDKINRTKTIACLEAWEKLQ